MTVISILGYPTQQLMTLLTPSQSTVSLHPHKAHSPYTLTRHTFPTTSQGTLSLHPHKAHSPHTFTRHTLPTPSQGTLSLHPHKALSLHPHKAHSPYTLTRHTLPTPSQGTLSPHLHKAHSPHTFTRHTLPTPSQDTLSLHPHTGMAHYTIHYGCDHLCSIMAHLAKHQYTLRQASFEWCIGYTAPHHILTPRHTTLQLTIPHLTSPYHGTAHITPRFTHTHTHVLFVPKGSLRVRVLGVSEYQTRRTPREAH